SARACRLKRSPARSWTEPPWNRSMRIFGPGRSARMPTSTPARRPASRTSRARRTWSAGTPCEKFSRTAFTPARTRASITPGASDAGPRVARMRVPRRYSDMRRASWAAGWVGPAILAEAEAAPRPMAPAPPAVSVPAPCERRDRGQRLALEELEEGAAAGGDVGHAVGDPVLVDRGQRVAAAGDRKRIRRRDRARQGFGALAEGVELEHANRPVPDHGAGPGDQRRVARRG